MPTFTYTEDDESSQESAKNSYGFRNWLYNSLDVFRRKKFARISSTNEERRKEEKEIQDKARTEALMKFQRKKQQHADSFKPKPKEMKVAVPTTSKQDQSKAWLEEYNHPSSTADVSIHEMVGSPVTEVTTVKLDTSFNSTLDLSSTFNSTAKSLFSTSMLAGNAGEKEATPKLPTLQLDAYAGARPSFGVTTVTSTPVAEKKTFAKQFQAPAKQTTPSLFSQPPPTALPQPPPITKSTPLFGQTIVLKTASPAKLVPIQESTFEICLPPPSVKPPTPVPVISKPDSPVTKSSFKNLVMYYSADLDRKDDNDISKNRFEKSGDTTLRGAIKRTINEKLSVCSKKHATVAELSPTIVFMAGFMSGKVVDSYNGQKLQVLDEGAVAYIYDTIINYSLSVVDKDDNLVYVMGSILRGCCQKNSTFESILYGHLFSSSALLALDTHISTTFVKSILVDPGRKTLAYGKEQSVIKLFFALHLANEGEEIGSSRLTMSNLWRTVAFILNSAPCIFSTLFLVIAFVEVCADKMKKVYIRQWPKLVSVIQNQLVPLLETNLLSSKLSEEADEARYITVLRSRLENL